MNTIIPDLCARTSFQHRQGQAALTVSTSGSLHDDRMSSHPVAADQRELELEPRVSGDH
jgi:hypothetical protein